MRNHASGVQQYVRSEFCTYVEHATRVNRRSLSDAAVRVDGSGRMDQARKWDRPGMLGVERATNRHVLVANRNDKVVEVAGGVAWTNVSESTED